MADPEKMQPHCKSRNPGAQPKFKTIVNFELQNWGANVAVDVSVAILLITRHVQIYTPHFCQTIKRRGPTDEGDADVKFNLCQLMSYAAHKLNC